MCSGSVSTERDLIYTEKTSAIFRYKLLRDQSGPDANLHNKHVEATRQKRRQRRMVWFSLEDLCRKWLCSSIAVLFAAGVGSRYRCWFFASERAGSGFIGAETRERRGRIARRRSQLPQIRETLMSATRRDGAKEIQTEQASSGSDHISSLTCQECFTPRR